MTDSATEATHEGLTFNQYHERELGRMAAMLVAAAGGKITVSRALIESLPGLQLAQTIDHATGDMVFATDYNDSFGEQQ